MTTHKDSWKSIIRIEGLVADRALEIICNFLEFVRLHTYTLYITKFI